MKLVVIIPIYNEQETLPVLFDRLTVVCEGMSSIDWRFILLTTGAG